MKFYLINENGAKVIDIPNTSEEIDAVLNYKSSYGGWNTPTIKVKGRQFIAVVCDLGKKIGLPISAITVETAMTNKLKEPFLVGPTLISKFDGKDDFATLDDKDIEILKSATEQSNTSEYLYKDLLLLD
ncbi:MAG: hypothetical protein K6E21_03575 [Bacilli bacterium]|nr:hypothetical protein [Bacilli bacterium]